MNKEYYIKNGETYEKAENDFFVMEDPRSHEKFDVPKSLEVLIGHVASYNRKDERAKLEDDIRDLTDQLAKSQKESSDLRERLKDNSGSKQIENLTKEHEKIVKAAEDKASQAEKEKEDWQKKFETYFIKNSIYSAISKSGMELHNIDDTVDILMSKANPKVSEKHDMVTGAGKGIYETILSLELEDEKGNKKIMESSPDEGIVKWLSQKENAFRIKNNLVPGAGTVQSGVRASGTGKTLSEAQFNSLHPKERAAFMSEGGNIV